MKRVFHGNNKDNNNKDSPSIYYDILWLSSNLLFYYLSSRVTRILQSVGRICPKGDSSVNDKGALIWGLPLPQGTFKWQLTNLMPTKDYYYKLKSTNT